jgi:hypothetical protein
MPKNFCELTSFLDFASLVCAIFKNSGVGLYSNYPHPMAADVKKVRLLALIAVGAIALSRSLKFVKKKTYFPLI